MADNTIDSLVLEISSNSKGAEKALDKLSISLQKMSNSLGGMNTAKFMYISKGIREMSSSLAGFSSNVKLADFNRVSNGLNKIAAIDAAGVRSTAVAMNGLMKSLNNLTFLNFDIKGITDVANGIAKLGRGTVTQAATNIPALTQSLKGLANGIKGLKIDFDISGLAQLTTAIQKLGSKSATKAAESNIIALGNALREMMSVLSKAPTVSQNAIQMTQSLAQLAAAGGRAGTASRSLVSSFNTLPASASKTHKSFSGLAGAIGKFYATYWIFLRAMGGFKKAIDISSDLTEVQNVVDVTFGEMADTMNEFADSALQNYGMSELMAKQIASRFQAMGVSMGFAQGKMSEMSIELTKLTGDMASFYNESQESVAKALQSIFTGETEPMRRFGLDLSFATVEAWALANGLEADMQKMTQAEKTMLRYQYVLANTGAASGDFLRTINSWHNQLVLLAGGFQQLGSIVGGVLINAFKPFIQALNNVMGAVINFAQVVSDALGAIFGWEYQTGGGVAQDLEAGAGAAQDIEDATGGAADNAKKLNKYIAGWHEVNNMTSNKDSGGSGGGGGAGGGGLADADGGKWIQKESLWEKYTSSIDSLYELGDYISGVLTDAMNSIDWNKVYESARNFGSGLASFLNGLITPELFGATGQTIAGALNMAIYAALSFGETFDWSNFGESIASGINNFFATFDFASLAGTINTWSKGILDAIISGINTVDWNLIGTQIGTFLLKIDFTEIASKIGKAIWKAINSGFKLYEGMFETAPLETALLTLVGVTKLLKSNNIKNFIKAVSDGISTTINFGKALSGSSAALETIRAVSPKAAKMIDTLRGSLTYLQAGFEIGAPIKGFTSAIDHIRTNLTGMDKLVIGAAASFGEFFVVKDSMKDLATGTGDVLTNILELVSSAGLAGAAMYTAFGPAGAAFAAVTALAAALAGLYDGLTENKELENWKKDFLDGLEEIDKKSETIKNSLSNLKADYDETGLAQAQMAKDMAQKYEELYNKLNPTAEEVAKMKQYSSDLVNMYPELEQYFNSETGLLETNRDEIQKTIDKQLELVKSKAALSALEESYVQQMKASQNLANAKEEEKTAYEELRKAHEEYSAYLESHPTYAQTGAQSLFEGDVFGVEAKKLQDAVAIAAEAVTAAKTSVSEAQSVYDATGKSISDFAESYEQSAYKTSVTSENVKKIFDDLKSGVEVSAPVLKAAFSTIGIELPNEIINSFSGKSSELKQKTIDLLSGLSEGKELSSEQLLQTFSSFGIELPDAMITALSGKNSDVQQAAISLLGQISAASESEREPLIEEFNSLGVGVIDDGIVASMNSSDNQNRAKTSVQGLFTVVKNAVIGEREPLKTEGKEDGKQLVEGTNSGIRDNQGSTKGVIGTWVSNITNWFTDFLGIASPSKVFRSFGGYTVEGFNEGLEREMGSTYSLIDRWSSGITDGFNVEIPRLDLEVPKPSFSSSSYNAGDLQTTMRMEMDARMARQQSELKQQNKLLQEQNELLRGIYNKPVLSDDDVFNATRRGQNRFAKRTFKTGWAGID
jgi:hypothetical protein